MKKRIAYLLLAVMLVLGSLSACGKTQTGNNSTQSESTQDSTEDQDDTTSIEDQMKKAVAYLRTMYKEAAKETPKDFERIGVVPVGKTKFNVTWSTDVSEDIIKIVTQESGLVLIDINDEVSKETPYVLTATITSPDGTQSQTYSWDHVIPERVTGSYAEIVEKAYELEKGASFPNEVTLEGIISKINTEWSDEYKNITVTILVTGCEDKPIMCYRLTGDGAKGLAVGDTITVTGIIKNYNGTIEFDTGCTLDSVVKGDGKAPETPVVSGTMQEIVDKAYALEKDTVLEGGDAVLTGIVSKINTEYSEQYKNVSVTILIEGRETKPILCYRLKGDDAAKIAVGDTITVKGTLKNYAGTVEFDAGCTLESLVKGDGKAPETPKVEGTMVEIVDKLYALEDGESLTGDATLTGSVTKIDTPYSADYKNITVTIVVEGRETKPVVCFRLKGTDAEKIAVGDLITVTGTLTNYGGTYEFTSGCVLDKLVVGGGTVTPDTETEDTETEVSNKKEATKNVMYLYQGKLEKTLYFNGKMNGYYLGTTEKISEAADVKVEEVDGGVRFYILDGETKQYIDTYKVVSGEKTYINVGLKTEPTAVYVFDKEANTYVTTIDETEYYLGTYSTYTTIGASDVSYVSSSYAISFKEVTIPYTFSVYQGKLEKTLYFTGEMSGYYLATSEKAEDAVTVYIEEVEGGVRFYFYNAENTKLYVDTYKNGDYINVGLKAEPTAVYVFDEEANTYVTTIDETDYYLGTYSSYTTLSASKISYISTSYPAVFVENTTGVYAEVEVEVEDEEDTETEDTETEEVTPLAEAMKAALAALELEAMTTSDVYELPKTITIEEVEYAITWTVTEENTTVATIGEDGYTLTIVASTSTDAEYKLTATVSDATETTEATATATNDWTYTVEKSNEKVATKNVMHLYQGKLKKTLYFNGKLSGNYLASTEDIAEAVVVEVEEVKEGETVSGYRLYFMDGETKTYIEAVTYTYTKNEETVTAVKMALATTPTMMYDYDEDNDTYVVTLNSKTYYVGAYSTYATFGLSETKYISSSYPTHVGEVVVPFKLALNQEKRQETVYFTGKMDSYYLGTTTNSNAAVDVYMEDVVENDEVIGVRFYFVTTTTDETTNETVEVKNYIDIYEVVSGENTYINVGIKTEPKAVYVYDAKVNTYVATIGEKQYFIGTSGTYATLSANDAAAISSKYVATFEASSTVVPVSNEKSAPKKVMYLYQGHEDVSKTLYFNGTISGNYLGTTDNLVEAVEVVVEEVKDGDTVKGYYLYFMDGETKTYIVISTYTSKDKTNPKCALVTEAPETLYTYDEEYDTYVMTIDEVKYYIGAYSDYTTFGASAYSYISGDGNYHITVDTVNTAFKLGLYQPNKETHYFFSGKMDSFYLGTTTNANEAVDVYIEAVEGGVRFYFMDGETKTYIDVYQTSSGYVNPRLTTEPTAVFVFDATLNAYVTTIAVTTTVENEDGTTTTTTTDKTYYLGTYKNFTTFGASEVSSASSSFVATLVESDLVEVEDETNTGSTTTETAALLKEEDDEEEENEE